MKEKLNRKKSDIQEVMLHLSLFGVKFKVNGHRWKWTLYVVKLDGRKWPTGLFLYSPIFA